MSNTNTTIKGTGIICKGNLNAGEFEMFPTMLFNYLQLKLITHTDVVVYVKLLQLYNHNEGYAYPTISKLMKYTNIRSKATIDNSLDRLREVGLIQTSKSPKFPNKNIYYVFKPLELHELYNVVPDKVEQFKQFETKLIKTAKQDKERYQQHQQERQEQNEQSIQAVTYCD
ncbi:helix-turn-helix domain-containing protein [Oceanobacillus oncorhynchi subsp. oncorhynchi]|uniref:helix-turn-helix domain-containing protein n=1 Tax=Oceanobacillus oncorhynchi TaxID=545501 RepID=UPI00362F78CF